MPDIERDTTAESAYADHLERSASVWDRWSRWYSLSERDFEPLRIDLINRLDLEPGATVLEIGCGPGVNFKPIRSAIGASGKLVAIDYSPAMVAKANARVERLGYENIEVVRADATTADLGDGYDAAIATLSLSVMPDIERAVENVHESLIPGGQLAVLDVGPARSGPLRIANPIITRFLRWYANWNNHEDVPEAVVLVFGGYRQHSRHGFDTVYTLTAERAKSDGRDATD